jgi:hypothetical protein
VILSEAGVKEMALVITLNQVAITNGVVMKNVPFGCRQILDRLRLAVTVID